MTNRIACLAIGLAVLSTQQEREPGKGFHFYRIEKESALGRQLAGEFRRDLSALEKSPALAVRELNRTAARKEIAGRVHHTFALSPDDPTCDSRGGGVSRGSCFVAASLILAAQDEMSWRECLAQRIAHVAGRDETKQATRAENRLTCGERTADLHGGDGVRAIGFCRGSPFVDTALGMLGQSLARVRVECAARLARAEDGGRGGDPGRARAYIEGGCRRRIRGRAKMLVSALPRRAAGGKRRARD